MICAVCGGTEFRGSAVLWPELVAEWALAPEEVAYVDRQQGECCTTCGSNLRSIALARGMARATGLPEPLRNSIKGYTGRILELNEAGTLHPVLGLASGLTYGAYPEVDMQALPYPDESFDVVIHSDTLEHVPQPVRALAECRRVLKRGGVLCYTVPTIVGRLSRRRDGLPRSFHGAPRDGRDDHLVISEYGADMWTEAIRAGFGSVEIVAEQFPAALALVAVKG